MAVQRQKADVRKLEPLYFGPCNIISIEPYDNYRVGPLRAGLHDVFHVSKLKLWPKEDEAIEQTESEPEKYLVEELTGRRVRKGEIEYKVKWLGWPLSQQTYVTRKSLLEDGFEQEVSDFDEKWDAQMKEKRKGKGRPRGTQRTEPPKGTGKTKTQKATPPPRRSNRLSASN